MKHSGRIIAGLALASLVFAAPVGAQDSGSMQVGNATVTVGAGSALLTLPDIEFTQLRSGGAPPNNTISKFENNDIDDEFGWNVNGSVDLPMGGATSATVTGFYARTEDDDRVICDGINNVIACGWINIVDDPSRQQMVAFAVGDDTNVKTERDVDHYGVALEMKRFLATDVMGVTRAPARRYLAVGADFRAIDQDIKIRGFEIQNTANILRYDEDLDTRYYGAYAAWGGDLPRLFLGGLWERWGLHSTFRLQGGAYYADTDYDGRYFTSVLTGPVGIDQTNLSLSESDVAFIGGLTLETTKQIGRRASLSLRSEYEYYSWVPEMAYNDNDTGGGCGTNQCQGLNVGTSIGDDDAFSARTSLRLTIKLGPDSVFEEPIK